MWIRLESKGTKKAGQLRTKLNLAGCQVVVASNKTTIAEVRDDHRAWMENLAKEYSSSWALTEKPRVLLPVSCGRVLATSTRIVGSHEGACLACRRLKNNKRLSTELKVDPSTVKVDTAVTVFKVPGLSDFSLEGLIRLMGERRDELLGLAQEYDSAVTSIGKIQELEGIVQKATADVAEHRKALEFFLREKKS